MNKSKSQDIKAKLERYKREREEMEQQRLKLRSKNSERAASMDSLRGGHIDSARNSAADVTSTINHDQVVETPADQKEKELKTYDQQNLNNTHQHQNGSGSGASFGLTVESIN